MERFEFILRRNFKEKGWRFFFSFFAFLIPGKWMCAFVSLLLFSRLLPWDIESGEEEALLSIPLRRYEVFSYDFLSGLSVLILSKIFSMSLWHGLDIGCVSTAMYVYGLSVLSSYAGKGNFLLPLVLISIDGALCWTWWRYLSPVCRGSWVGYLFGISIFVLAFLVYSTDGKLREGLRW